MTSAAIKQSPPLSFRVFRVFRGCSYRSDMPPILAQIEIASPGRLIVLVLLPALVYLALRGGRASHQFCKRLLELKWLRKRRLLADSLDRIPIQFQSSFCERLQACHWRRFGQSRRWER